MLPICTGEALSCDSTSRPGWGLSGWEAAGARAEARPLQRPGSQQSLLDARGHYQPEQGHPEWVSVRGVL